MKKLFLLIFSIFYLLGNEVSFADNAAISDMPTNDIPEEVKKWIDDELAKAKRKTLIDLDSDEFFRKEPARVVGYIKGYDRSMGFSTGIVYAGSELTREDYPRVIEVHEDGRFEVTIPLDHPIYTYLSLSKALPHFYIEPGQTLAIIFDKNNMSNRQMKDGIVFMGPLAQINKELLYLETIIPEIPYQHIYSEETMKLDPDAFTQLLDETLLESLSATKFHLEQEELTPHTKTIAGINSMAEIPKFLFEYASSYSYYRNDREAEVPVEFYSFLRGMPLNDQKLLISSSFSTFINRFEYFTPFKAARINVNEKAEKMAVAPEKTFREYLFEELKLPSTKESKEYIHAWDTLEERLKQEGKTEDDTTRIYSEFDEKRNAFIAKYKDYENDYKVKYPSIEMAAAFELAEWVAKDSVYKEVVNSRPGLIYEIMKVRSLDYSFSSRIETKGDARLFLSKYEDGITHPFLKQEAERLLNKNYPENGAAGYIMPEDEKGTEIMKKIIDPFKGKMLFVDFWGIFCGPCVAGIKDRKETRAEHKGNPDFEFIFITSDGESPLDRYNTFVEEQQLEHTYRLTDDEYLYLRQLFKFNGIPRYVVIDKEGRVLDDDFNMYSFEYELKKLKGELK